MRGVRVRTQIHTYPCPSLHCCDLDAHASALLHRDRPRRDDTVRVTIVGKCQEANDVDGAFVIEIPANRKGLRVDLLDSVAVRVVERAPSEKGGLSLSALDRDAD